MHLLVTGGCGFIGKNFIRLLERERPDWTVINLDALTYAASPAGLPEHWRGYRFVKGDIRDRDLVNELVQGVDAVVNFAAESHVDRSILSSFEFISTNVLGSQCLLDSARAVGVPTFLQVSTDEVYGSLEPQDPPFEETTPLSPRSPYAASKAAADLLVLSYFQTYGMDVRITRCSNNYGPYQFPEKLIPLTIINALNGRAIPIYGDGRQRRDWIHVEDHCRGIIMVLERGRPGEVYNFGASEERENRQTIQFILRALGASESLMTQVKDRPGHDRRYAINATRARTMGWTPMHTFEEGIQSTVSWYQGERAWWDALMGPDYEAYYVAQYGTR